MHPDNILAAPSHPDPYPYYAALVAGPPLVFDAARKLWIAASAAAVNAVLGNPACRVRPAAEPVPQAIVGSAAGEVFGHLVRMNDGARHDAPKLALQRFLAALDLDRVAKRTGLIATKALGAEPLCAAALSDWTFDAPVMAVADALGFAEADLPRIAAWTRDFVTCLSPLSTPEQLAAAGGAAANLLTRFSALVQEDVNPDSAVARVQLEAQAVGWNDAAALLANLVGLLSQTCEATAGLVGNSLVALATQPGLAETVGQDRSKVLQMVNEVSRHDPSIHNTRRFVAEATEVEGVSLQAGDAILVVLAAAGRDPLCNPEPDRFLLDRVSREVPGFGKGAHQCPGQSLACTVAAAAVQALLDSGKLQLLKPGGWRYRLSMNARIPVFSDGYHD